MSIFYFPHFEPIVAFSHKSTKINANKINISMAILIQDSNLEGNGSKWRVQSRTCV